MAIFKRSQKTKLNIFNLDNFLRLKPKLSIINLQDLKTAFETCPPIASIINRRAQLFSKAEIKFYRNGIEKENETLKKIFKNPNFQDSENSFLQKIGFQLALYRNCFVYVKRKNIGGLLQEGDMFFVLDAPNVEVNYQKTQFQKITKLNDIIQSYSYFYENSKITFRPDEIIWITDQKDELQTPYKSLEIPINVYSAAYQVYYALYRRNGGFGIFSNDAAGEQLFNSEISEKEIQELQEKMKRYTFDPDEYHFIITNSKLKYQPISFPISEMQLYDAMKRSISDICSIIGYEPILILGTEGTTFANLKEATKRVYTEYIIPDWQLFETSLNSSNLATDYIAIDYSKIEPLQVNELEKEQILKTKQDRILQLFNNGIISIDDVKKILNI